MKQMLKRTMRTNARQWQDVKVAPHVLPTDGCGFIAQILWSRLAKKLHSAAETGLFQMFLPPHS